MRELKCVEAFLGFEASSLGEAGVFADNKSGTGGRSERRVATNGGRKQRHRGSREQCKTTSAADQEERRTKAKVEQRQPARRVYK